MKFKTFMLLTLLFSSPLFARMSLRVGPASMGVGGSNPISIPPTNPLDYEYLYLTQKSSEFCLSIVPGVLIGHRFTFNNKYTYISTGGGYVVSYHASGLGIYSSIGLEIPMAGSTHFNIELKQALGVSSHGIHSASAFRLGVSFEF